MTSSHKPRKRFGQNFLHDQNIIYKIIDLIHPQPDDQIIEIGPGQGAITLPLLEKVPRLDAIEIDRDLIAWWKQQALTGLTLHECDALRVDYCDLRPDKSKKARIVGNLPYNISTPILFHLFENKDCITDMHFMLQKEVVERMTSGPGSKSYGRLSIMVQYYCEVENLFTVGSSAFTPPPKVESAIVRLRPYSKAPVNAEPGILQKVVTQAFSQRRKTIRNSLKALISAENLSSLGLDPGCRAETLSLQAFAQIANYISSEVS